MIKVEEQSAQFLHKYFPVNFQWEHELSRPWDYRVTQGSDNVISIAVSTLRNTRHKSTCSIVIG